METQEIELQEKETIRSFQMDYRVLGINLLTEALAKAQGAMDSAKKDSNNPFYKSKYADLSSVIDAIKKPLSDNGLAYTQLINAYGDKTLIETRLMHISGQAIESRMIAKPAKDDMQSLGSAITYARRYALQAIVGLAAEDDDGNEASQTKVAVSSKPKVSEPIAKDPEVKRANGLPSQSNSDAILVAKINKLANGLFKDALEFQAWRTDNGLCSLIRTSTYVEKEELLSALEQKAGSNVNNE